MEKRFGHVVFIGEAVERIGILEGPVQMFGGQGLERLLFIAHHRRHLLAVFLDDHNILGLVVKEHQRPDKGDRYKKHGGYPDIFLLLFRF